MDLNGRYIVSRWCRVSLEPPVGDFDLLRLVAMSSDDGGFVIREQAAASSLDYTNGEVADFPFGVDLNGLTDLSTWPGRFFKLFGNVAPDQQTVSGWNGLVEHFRDFYTTYQADLSFHGVSGSNCLMLRRKLLLTDHNGDAVIFPGSHPFLK